MSTGHPNKKKMKTIILTFKGALVGFITIWTLQSCVWMHVFEQNVSGYMVSHIRYMYICSVHICANTRRYSSSFFPRTALLWNSLPVSCFPATCLSSKNATSIVIFVLFDFLFSYPLSPFLALTLSGLLRLCDWQLPIKKNIIKKKKKSPSRGAIPSSVLMIATLASSERCAYTSCRYVMVLRAHVYLHINCKIHNALSQT